MSHAIQPAQARPRWMTALMIICAGGVPVNIFRDLFVPAARGIEVWFGFEITGWAAHLTAPIHWVILGVGAWGFWKMRPWMWPWAAVYVFYVALALLVWSEASVNGRGWMIGLLQAAATCVVAVALWRARLVFQPPESVSHIERKEHKDILDLSL